MLPANPSPASLPAGERPRMTRPETRADAAHPCRTCGREPVWEVYVGHDWRSVQLRCRRCGASATASDARAALAAWNEANAPAVGAGERGAGVVRRDAVKPAASPTGANAGEGQRAKTPGEQWVDDLHAAGGHRWDGVADPDAAIREMRGEDGPSDAASRPHG